MADINPPNYTQIPNVILDLMADMEDTELRIVLAIARKTFGWHKERDQLSLSQLVAITGLSKPGVMTGIASAIERGLVERCPSGKQSFSYRLLVKPVYRSTEFTSKTILPEPVKPVDQSLVKPVYTQKKDVKKERNDDVAAALKSVGMTGKQRRDILEAQPDLTPGDVAAWQSFREAPPPWCDKPEGYIYRRLLDGDAPPLERTNGNQTMTDAEKEAKYYADFYSKEVSPSDYRSR